MCRFVLGMCACYRDEACVQKLINDLFVQIRIIYLDRSILLLEMFLNVVYFILGERSSIFIELTIIYVSK